MLLQDRTFFAFLGFYFLVEVFCECEEALRTLKATKLMRAKAAQQFPEESGLIQETKHWIGPRIPALVLPLIPHMASTGGFCSTSMDSKWRQQDTFHLIAET